MVLAPTAMRSGFLNACPSSEASISSSSVVPEKGIRNKRKFRTDHVHGTAPQARDVGLEDVNNDCCSSSTSGSSCSVKPVEASSCIPERVPCSSIGACSIPHSCLTTNEIDVSNVTSLSARPDVLASCFCHRCCKEDIEHANLQEPDWDKSSESQLEQILIDMLDALYKEAVAKVVSLGHSQKAALNAVLKNGRWNGKDALMSVVESSLTWLQSGEARQCMIDFTNLNDMERHVLAEMVCLLRKVRPFLSKGDAMWCLLVCDLNLLLACAMEDDILPQPPTTSNLKTCPRSPGQNAVNHAVPLPQQTPHLSPAVVQLTSGAPFKQPLGGLGNLSSDNRSAFSTPSFSTSSVGKVAVAARQTNVAMPPYSSKITKLPPYWPCNIRSSAQDIKSEVLNSSNLNKLAEAKVGSLEHQNVELGTCTCASNDEICTDSPCLCQNYLHMRVNPADMSAVPAREKHALKIYHCPPQTFQTACETAYGELEKLNSPGPNPRSVKAGDDRASNMGGRNADHQKRFAKDGFSHLSDGSWSTCVTDHGNRLLVPEAKLCLATNPTTFPALVSGNLQAMNIKEVSTRGNHAEILGCSEAAGEQRKTEMLEPLVDRAKLLEAQLQGWSEWAQQKVMQAAQRLRKDSTELKALRLERDEYARLKTEKQNSEESTMKKLSEMENALRKALSQVDRANAAARRLKAENAEVRAEMESAKSTAAEYVASFQEAAKRGNKSVKKVELWDRQKIKLQDELIEVKQQLATVFKQLSQAKECHKQAGARWQQEKKAKADALAIAEFEKRAKEQAEVAFKRQEEVSRSKTEAKSQYHREEVQKLQSEVSQLKTSLGLQPTLTWSHSSWPEVSYSHSVETYRQINAQLFAEILSLQNSQKDIHRDRECVMCMNAEKSIVFLPCAHQSLCIKCNELQIKKGLKDCSICRTPIQQRIRVYGVNST